MKEVPSPETMSHEQYIWEKLLPDVREMVPGLNVTSDCAMPCMPEPDSKIAYVMNQQHPQVDDPFDYVDFVNEQKAFRQALSQLSDNGIADTCCTDRSEVLFFSNSPLDCRGLNNSIRNC